MENWKLALEQVEKGKILDVATGTGGFLDELNQYLIKPEEMVGIDANQESIDKGKERFKERPYQFFSMDAHEIHYPNEYFDLVAISNSLHHFEQPIKVLEEMTRVLKLGGILLVYEMVRDNQTDSQMSHVLMHDFWGKIDSQIGRLHNPTFTQKQLRNLLEAINGLALKSEELEPTKEEELEAAEQEELKEIMNHYVELAKENQLQDIEGIEQQAEEIMAWVEKAGFASASQYFYLLEKMNR